MKPNSFFSSATRPSWRSRIESPPSAAAMATSREGVGCRDCRRGRRGASRGTGVSQEKP
jgi:hypothetical protein